VSREMICLFMPSSLLFSLLSIIPLLLAASALAVLKWTRGDYRKRNPFPEGEKGLRWPGYSLQKEVESIEEKLNSYLTFLVALPPFALGGYIVAAGTRGESLFLKVTFIVPATCALVWILISLVNCARALKRKRLGMLGEQMTGEHLNLLMRDGCHVFHDFPCGRWNIDHIVIGETGVFIVETKLRRKLIGKGADIDKVIAYDGSVLHFVKQDYRNSSALNQARRAARELEQFIEERACLKASVTAILTFPGWWIDRKGKGDVTVVNSKEIRQVVTGKKRDAISPEQINRIVAVVEAECRDVEW
jgi:hypothetical protein